MKLIKNLLLSLAAIIFFLGAAEAYLSIFRPVNYRKPHKLFPDHAWCELLHRHSAVPGLAYELVPDRDKFAHGSCITTNSFGMRDDEPRTREDKSVRRIAVLGDSFTFGFGVEGDETYPNVLERLLNQAAGRSEFEVLNFGVGGYSTQDEALVLRYKALSWDPDLVVVGYYLNDPETEPIQELHEYYQDTRWWQYSSLLRLLAQSKQEWDIHRYGGGDYYRYLHSRDGPKWQSVVDSFAEIRRLTAERGISVLLVIFPATKNRPWAEYPYLDLHKQVSDLARENGMDVIDLYEEFARHPARNLMVIPGDDHPSTLGHELAGEAIYRWISARMKLESKENS